MRNKIGLKIQGWRQRLLTFSGREILIKVVANAILTYPMACFSFPIKTCKELDRMIFYFWWGNEEDGGGKIH